VSDRAELPVPPAQLPQPDIGMDRQQQVANKSTRRPIQVSYSETRVQAMDPEKMKNNRIFSFFDEIETTNQIKILRTQVLKRLEAIGGNSILVTSANPHEGKTFTSINLGVSIAKEFSRTVLIVDADLRKPTKRHADFSTDFFSIDVEFGLTEYLKGEADIRDILINPGIERLILIPAGKPVDNAPELLNSERMAEMMSDVKSRYGSERLVIVDGPALLPFPDARILTQYVDGVIPVVEMERTPTGQLKKMMDILQEARILGTVLNKQKG
jgi:non-specific protein-tyrosine kinase